MKYDIPLISALMDGHPAIAHKLIELGDDVNVVVEDGETPLFFAVNYEDVFCHLLQAGAQATICNRNGETPLHLVAEYGTATEATVLIQYGADVEARDPRNQTPLHVAAALGNYPVAEALVQHGADVNACGADGGTPLHCAVYGNIERRDLSNHLKTAKILIDAGASLEVRTCDQQTPLDLAKRHYGYPELASLLIEHGASA